MAQNETKVLTAYVQLSLADKVDPLAASLTREAMADVKVGHVIDYQAVQTWADDNPLPTPAAC